MHHGIVIMTQLSALSPGQDDDLDENFVTARNTMVQTAGGTMISAGGAVDDTITDLGTLVIVGEPDDVEEMDTMKSECVCVSVCVYMCIYRIAGNFRGRKLSRISQFFRHPRKFSPRNSRHATPIMRPLLTFRESFLREMLLSHRSSKVFSLENFPLYGIMSESVHTVRV